LPVWLRTRHAAIDPGRRTPFLNYAALAMRWRKRHPCARYHDEHRGRDKGAER
jgi:hypothetical protein